MKSLLTLASFMFVASVFAAKPPSGQDASLTQVMKDRHFQFAQCHKYLAGYSKEETLIVRNTTGVMLRDESLRFVTGSDSIVGDFQNAFNLEHIDFNPAFLDARKRLQGARNFRSTYTDSNYSTTNSAAAFEEWERVVFDKGKFNEDQAAGCSFAYCCVASIAAGLGLLADYPQGAT